MAILEAVFADKAGQTPQEVERRRRMAQALLDAGSGGKAPSSGLELAGRLAMTLTGQYQAGKAEKQDAINRSAANSALIDAVYGTSPSSSGGTPFTTNAPGAGETVSAPSKPINMDGNEVYNQFITTAREGGLTNPYGLAALAATGKAESGFSPGNVNRTWSDPSESGQPGRAGGILSWRGPRYEALAATGDLSPAGQARFFLKEDPQLIQALNNAKSVEEAQQLMNRAWQFAGWNRPGGEAANRLGYATAFLPSFQGQSQQVASLDPSIGMPPQNATGAVNAMAANAPGSLSEEVAAYQQTPEYAARFPGRRVAPTFPGKQADDMAVAALPQPVNVGANPVPPNSQPMPQGIPAEFAGSQQLANAQGGIIPALMGGTAASPEQVAQARALGNTQPQPQPQGQDNRALIATLLGNPYTAEAGQQLLMAEMQRRQEASDPIRQMQMEEQRLKLNAMRNPPPDYDMITGKDGSIFRADKRTGNIEQVYGGKPDKFRTLTDAEEQQLGLDTSKAYQVGADNKVAQIGGGGTTVNIDQKAEGAFDKKLAEKQAETFDTMATEGLNARADIGIIQELDTLLQGQGGTLSGIAGIAAKYGIGGEGMGDLQAVQALINKLVPTQRAPGSGSMSDRDVELFTRSLPSLWNEPGGNAKILRVMRGLAEYKQAQGEIADQVLTGDMSRQEARRALRALPNPLAQSDPSQDVGKVPEGVDPEDWKALTPEERKLWQ